MDLHSLMLRKTAFWSVWLEKQEASPVKPSAKVEIIFNL